MVAWLAVRLSKTAIPELLRVGWATVGVLIDRVVARDRRSGIPSTGLSRIGIDEISYKKGHRYLMVVVDHRSGRLVWAKAGHYNRATLEASSVPSVPSGAPASASVRATRQAWIAEEA